MTRLWRPVAVGAVVVVAVFVLAQWVPFAPSTTASTTAPGDSERGQVVFGANCASCHGDAGEGGVGPPLAASGLTANEIGTVIDQGRGVMPAGLVQAQDRQDVIAFVESISTP